MATRRAPPRNRTKPRVTLICLTDRPLYLHHFLSMMALQTLQAWELLLLEQSDATAAVLTGDPRVLRRRVQDRRDWGQTEKMAAVAAARGAFVGFPNDDGYYAPLYLEAMLVAAHVHSADLVYCDWVSASDMGRHRYVPYQGAPVTGHIDVGGFLVKRDAMLAHGWPDNGPTGDGSLVESLVRSRVRHHRVDRTLYVKN